VPITCSSPPVIGSPVYEPQAKWAFPRSYVYGLTLACTGFTWTQNENEFVSNTVPGPPTNIHVVVKPNVYEWSSNVYTLDYVVCECFYLRLLTGEKVPAPYQIDPHHYNSDGLRCLRIWLRDGGFGSFADFPIPGQPGDYWLPI